MRPDFSVDDFGAFIAERHRTMLVAIESLLIKDRLDLPVDLRNLDADVEVTELKLRAFIHGTIGENWANIPEHLKEKINQRISTAARKNATFDTERYETFKAKLEFFDLRELQDIITAKSLWPDFQNIFGQKDTLNIKFDQLSELRNAIRHSRFVAPVTQKEGEAAILWFEHLFSM